MSKTAKLNRAASRMRWNRARRNTYEVPVVPYEECLEEVRGGGAPFTALYEYEGWWAPPPEKVARHILDVKGTLKEEEWGELIRYMAIRCGVGRHHYRTCLAAVRDLVGKWDKGSRVVSAGMCGLALYGGDASRAVTLLRGANTFHSAVYSWTALPQIKWINEVEVSPLARLQLATTHFYTSKLRQGYPATLLAMHAFLQHAVIRNDARLYWSLVRHISSWDGTRPPLLLPETVSLILTTSSSFPSLDPDTASAVSSLLRYNRVQDDSLDLLPQQPSTRLVSS
eukprot:TRINITY_DN12749_c0_g1_i1.p1 TRINITY_DN12749_c0_g1~~TRINITY_DN12749_c0_g1_i1.p1  ORF type:complete len:307 (+),score=34.04 TRINITY_DN12749_c0_g1_i1:74-922(+)